jgi:two-component system, OmpR family, sensor histidine kinase MprB
MSFRARLTLVSAAAVALAVVAASAIVYVVVRGEVRGRVDDGLRDNAQEISHESPDHVGRALFKLRAEIGGAVAYPQVVQCGVGEPFRGTDESVALPISDRVRDIACKGSGSYFADAHVAGTHVRLLNFAYPPNYTVQLARSLTDVDRTLGRIRTILFLIAFGGVALAVALGLIISGAALAPIRRLTRATENVAETGNLSERIEVSGSDELSRLACSFNSMLAALEESTRTQRQLVADASHELRTPLTSLRTNIEVLASERALPPGERERLLHDVVEQLGEMTTLIAELMELARGEQHPAEPEEVRLDLVAADAVERTRRNRPTVTFDTEFEESVVHGVPSTIERAVANLLDNAAKWSPQNGSVEVGVHDGEVTVRDHGPGIAEEDLPYVFDRFYRAASARGLPGSGLGLAIVKQVAEAHGGQVVAERAEGGGTRMTLRLNGRKPVATS